MKDYFGYEGKVCVVTGAASGMGRAAAEMLVDLGAEVYALDWAETDIPGIKTFISTDLSQKASIDAAFEKIPQVVDRFFGCAGVSGQKHDYTTTVSINFISNKYITEEYLLERMPDLGAIAYITSAGGLRWERPDNMEGYLPVAIAEGWQGCLDAIEASGCKEQEGRFGYALSKRALNYYVAYILSQFAQKKVRVNAILPGATQSGLTADFAINTGGVENLIKYTGFAQRLAESREMAEPLVYLNSDMASYISGVLLDIDFGMNIRMVAGLSPDMYGRRS
jgi:Dehydrogenases with different specificities (related to short-chain alcohol dehydrogenases)